MSEWKFISDEHEEALTEVLDRIEHYELVEAHRVDCVCCHDEGGPLWKTLDRKISRAKPIRRLALETQRELHKGFERATAIARREVEPDPDVKPWFHGWGKPLTEKDLKKTSKS